MEYRFNEEKTLGTGQADRGQNRRNIMACYLKPMT